MTRKFGEVPERLNGPVSTMTRRDGSDDLRGIAAQANLRGAQVKRSGRSQNRNAVDGW